MPSFKGQLSDKQIADVDRLRGHEVRRQPERLSAALRLPEDFPRDVRVVATDFDRTLVWDGRHAAAADDRGDASARTRRACHVIVVTGRMVKSVRQCARAGRARTRR